MVMVVETGGNLLRWFDGHEICSLVDVCNFPMARESWRLATKVD